MKIKHLKKLNKEIVILLEDTYTIQLFLKRIHLQAKNDNVVLFLYKKKKIVFNK